MDSWHDRLKRERKARQWTQRELARQLIASSARYRGYDEQSIERTIKRWEQGAVALPRPETQEAIARVFGSVPLAFFQLEPSPTPRTLTDDQAAETIARLRASSLDDTTLEMARLAVDQLCVDYCNRPAAAVQGEAEDWLRELEHLRRDSHPNLRQSVELHDMAGWLSLLVSCLRYDTDDDAGAERVRRMALSLGNDVGSPDILGWAHEIQAWMALTHGDLSAVFASVNTGVDAAKGAPVTVQLHAQAAKAWARVGNRTELRRSLDAGRAVLERMPAPTNARNHFQVDPAKWDFYTMDCARRVGDDALAWSLAETVVNRCATPAGAVISPMRLAEAQLTKAAVEARAGEVDIAAERATQALEGNRRSLPSLIMVGREVADIIGDHPTGHDFRHHLTSLRPAV